ncbi:MAG TPA: hypothetical protein DEP48_01630 [Persephonella sp.]|uniref:Uncharacterized protein n=1 Tax=Persephonella marina (strain DSM 14350 / EX-H1) TaxID=123214 RepID=C0QRJ6_PERMH|nr:MULTISPECIES: hypothetical protein [Persephonella]ACO02979.1 conserved hypothetical protein [Persephonella marina EX-H1]HCB69037.1 hypothetical protein [Persephonella sp.]
MSQLSKNNKTVKVYQLKEYLKDYPNRVVAEIYLEVLQNFDDDELVPDLILENLLLSPEDFKEDA